MQIFINPDISEHLLLTGKRLRLASTINKHFICWNLIISEDHYFIWNELLTTIFFSTLYLMAYLSVYWQYIMFNIILYLVISIVWRHHFVVRLTVIWLDCSLDVNYFILQRPYLIFLSHHYFTVIDGIEAICQQIAMAKLRSVQN